MQYLIKIRNTIKNLTTIEYILMLALGIFGPITSDIFADKVNSRLSNKQPRSPEYVVSNPGGVILQFPAPGPSPQDLAWDGEYLWLADDSADTIYKLNPLDGTVLATFKTPGSEPRGLTWDGYNLWISDNSSYHIDQLSSVSGLILKTINVSVVNLKDGKSSIAGLAWDGNCLWSGYIAGWSSRMNQVNCQDGSIKRLYYTKGVPRALTADSQFLWSATDNGGYRPGTIYKYDISNGSYISQMDTPGDYPSGLAFDGENLWCVDKQTKLIYKLKIE